MGFWGIEVKPGKSHPYHSDNVQGKLHVTQATLGLGSSNEKSILQCSVGHKNPIFLCSLLPNKIESCPLDLEFDEDDLVAFSVIGKQSIHLSGYFVSDNGDYLRDEYDTDSYGEDIADTESDESSEFDTEDEYGDDFIDDDNDELFPPSPVRNSGVVIEEIMDEDKPTLGNVQSKKLKKKDQASDSEKRIIVKNGANVPIVESEDEDGFPVSKKSVGNSQQTQMKVDEVPDKKTSEEVEKSKQSTDQEISRKRKDKNTDQDDQQERKKKKKQKEKAEEGKLNEAGAPNETNDFLEEANQQELKGDDVVQKECKSDANEVPSESQPEKKKKKQKKKKQAQENEGDKPTDQTVSTAGDKMETTSSAEKMQSATKSTKTRTFPNGLVIEELAMGKPDAKRASPGKQVSVQYIGKLQKNGKIFDSNVGRAPFKFRLGVGEVIKGWDVGVNGMRVGDKRRLTIPPAMGYGTKGAGGKIPPNAWLMFDVELKGVR